MNCSLGSPAGGVVISIDSSSFRYSTFNLGCEYISNSMMDFSQHAIIRAEVFLECLSLEYYRDLAGSHGVFIFLWTYAINIKSAVKLGNIRL